MTARLPNAIVLFAALLVLLLTLWVYWPGQSGPALLDDASSVLVIGDLREQPELAWDYVTGDTSGPLGRPVSVGSFVLEKLLLDGGLALSKRINILLHLVNGTLVIWLFWLLFQHLAVPGYSVMAVLLGAAWLLSPFFVSTVLYVVQRMALLSTSFMLLACLCYVGWRLRLLRGNFSLIPLLLMAACVLFAVLAKENAVVVIPVVLLLEALWFQFEGPGGSIIRWLRLSTLLLIVLGTLFVLVLLLFDYDGLAAAFQFRYFTLEERLLTQTRLVWNYVMQLLVPDVFRMGLYHDDVTVSSSLRQPVSTLYALLAWSITGLLFIILLWRRRGRYIAMGIGWFVVAHSVESTVLPLELYFEHRNYFPAVGLFLLVGAIFTELARRWPEVRSPLMVYVGCYALWLAGLTGSQVQIWSSHPLLILHHLNAHPGSFRANADMAVQMANVGEFAAAQDYSARAFAVSRVERSGDRDIRDIALACIANQPVEPWQIMRLGSDNLRRPFSSVVTLQTLVHLLQDDACPSFDRILFADRMAEIYLAKESPATAAANIYQGLALLENVLQRWQYADAYVDRFLQMSPADPQGLLMKLHFVSALGKVAEINAVRTKLLLMQEQGQLTVGQQQTLALYLE